mmetsp:Transcript_11880/g.49771  ORF Transcript_11880/g.49771 Transcript_11880/m.49771 type:complete len:561 (+) Transcript_11880:77-1759(+)
MSRRVDALGRRRARHRGRSLSSRFLFFRQSLLRGLIIAPRVPKRLLSRVTSARRLPADVAVGLARVHGVRAELLLDAQQLVVLGQTLGAAGRAGLDLASRKTHGEIRDVGILGFARAVGRHDAPARLLGHAHRLDRLGDGTDLVHLEQQRVARLGLDGGGDALGVGDEQVIAHNLAHARAGKQAGVLKVILVEGVLDGHDGVLGAELLVHLDHLLAGLLHGAVVVLRLEVQVVHLVLGVELGGGDVHANLDLAGVPSLLDRLLEQLEALLVLLDVGREAALVADVARVLAVLGLDHGLQVVVHLGAHAHRLGKRGRADGEDHELLHGELVARVRAAVDHVERGHGEHELAVAGEVRDVLVEGHALLRGASLGDGHGHREDRVGAELALVLGAVELDHEVVDGLLIRGVLADERGRDDGVDVLDSLRDALAHPLGLVAVAELDRLVDARGGAGGGHSAEHALVRVDVRLDRGVAAGVENLAADDLGDGGGRLLLQVLSHEGDGLGSLGLDGGVDHVLDLLAEGVLLNVLLDAHVVVRGGSDRCGTSACATSRNGPRSDQRC